MLYSLIDHKDLTNYITSLPKTTIEKIFDHPTTCLAIFRDLTELAKLIVIRLLLLNQEVPQATVQSWVNSKYQTNSLEATKILTSLGVLQNVHSQGGMPGWILRASFKENLFQGIFRTSTTEIENTDSNGDQQTNDLDFLDKLDNYAVERWESVLKYIVNPKDAKIQIGNSTKDVLRSAGLMKAAEKQQQQSNAESGEESCDTLTASAFQFLLWNRKVQVWYFIIQLLEYTQEKGNDISECLTLLFELSFSTFGKDYSCENFSQNKTEFLQELRKLGLVFMKTRKIKRFYPTRLAIQLSNGINTSSDGEKEEKGYIIVETNYRYFKFIYSVY